MVGLSRKRVFPKTKGDSITGQDRAQKHCDFRFSQIEKKSKVAVLQLGMAQHHIHGKVRERYTTQNCWRCQGRQC